MFFTEWSERDKVGPTRPASGFLFWWYDIKGLYYSTYKGLVITLYRYYILYGMTWKIIIPRKHCQPRRSRSRQCFSRGDDLPCHPVKNDIFILLCLMSPYPTQLQYFVIKLLYTPGDIFTECCPLLRLPPLVSQIEPYMHLCTFARATFFVCHPPYYSPC